MKTLHRFRFIPLWLLHQHFSAGFQTIAFRVTKQARLHFSASKAPTFRQSSSTAAEKEANDDEFYEAVACKLAWETLEEANARPVLNLSGRNDSPEIHSQPEQQDQDQKDSLAEWKQKWQTKTLPGLLGLGIQIENHESDFLGKCPQLLRLDPALVLETATWFVEEFGCSYISKEPSLLSFRQADAAYGVEFLGTMMMVGNEKAKLACAASPALLRSGIEGGIQERAVERALGAAGQATATARQNMAGDAMQTLRHIQNQKSKGL